LPTPALNLKPKPQRGQMSAMVVFGEAGVRGEQMSGHLPFHLRPLRISIGDKRRRRDVRLVGTDGQAGRRERGRRRSRRRRTGPDGGSCRRSQFSSVQVVRRRERGFTSRPGARTASDSRRRESFRRSFPRTLPFPDPTSTPTLP